jgi:hypothetical protein
MARPLIVVMGLCSLLLGCGDDRSTSPSANTPGAGLQLDFAGLPPLEGGFHYEGWAIIQGQPFSTGKFNVNGDGAVVSVSGAPIAGGAFQTNVDVGVAGAIVITIERAGDTDAAPAATKILAGGVSNRTASLSVGAAEALGNDFAQARGLFILATPTNGMDTDETSGVWFLDPRSGSPVAGLTLPSLPAGWSFEGWTVIEGIPVTTGRFLRASGADEDAPFSGPLPGPPFPGEDFLENAPGGLSFPRDLAGGMTVITIEPSPDDSPAPFALKPLIGDIPSPSQAAVVFPMANRAGDLPRGTATIR